MTVPIWFLDIDGVVNAAGLDLPPHLVRTDATTAGTTWPIHYSPEVIEFINTVHRSGLAEIRWLTTWEQDARTSFAPAVGLDEFLAYDMYDGDGWWKAEIVAASVADEKRPIIWTDDDITASDVADFPDSAQVQPLLVPPATEIGLTSSDLRRILGFARASCTRQDLLSPESLDVRPTYSSTQEHLMTDPAALTNAQLFAQFSASLRELRVRDVLRTNNQPAGDYAEWLAQRALGGVLAPNAEKSFDLTTDDGTLVQVKARSVSPRIKFGQLETSVFRSWDFDQALLV